MRCRFFGLIPVVVALAACSKKEPPPAQDAQLEQPAAAESAAAPNPAIEAKQLFNVRCSVCHGQDGTGNGPGAAALTPKPRNYTDAEWQKSVTDQQLRDTILLGGAAVGKSPAMPSNPDLKTKPEVLDELVKHVRSFAKQ